MNSNLSLQSPNPYKFYFSPNSTLPFPDTHHNKENVSNSNSKPQYQFYFKQSHSSIQTKISTPKQTPIKVQSRKPSDPQISKAISHLIDFTQMASLSFQSFLGAAIIFFKLNTKTQIDPKQSPALALSSLFISSKVFEIQELSVGQISQMTGNKVSKKKILAFEGWIMEKLQFDLFLQNHLQKTFDQIFNQALSSDEDAMGKVQMLIQMCLLRGNQIFVDGQYMKWIGKFVMDEKENSSELNLLKNYLKGLRNSHQLRSLLVKWSFKIDTDSTVSKLQI